MEDTDDTPTRRALLLIDFQHDFMADDGRMPIERTQVVGVVDAARAAIDQAQSADELIVKIGNEFRRNDFVGNAFRHHAAMAGSPGARWDPRIDAGDAIYLAKWKGDAFCNPELHQVLSDHGIERLLLAGLFARACVTATAKGAIARGFEVQLVIGAIACRTDATRDAALARLSKRGIGLAPAVN